MNIDFIKWMCEKTEWMCTAELDWYVRTPDEDCCFQITNPSDMKDTGWTDVYYPLLLQRAIEEINQSDDTCYFIQINLYSVCITNVDTGKDIFIADYNGSDGNKHASSKEVDQAKEAALKYILEQETK